MIRFLNDETVAGYRYGKGTISRFDEVTEVALIAQGDAEDYPAVSKPVEVLSNSAVPASCALTATDEVLGSFTVRAGIIGVNSIIQIEPLWTFTSSANNKILKVKVGNVTVYSATRTTSIKEAPLIVLANRNSLASQIQPYDNTYLMAGSGTPATYTINFANSVTVDITGQRANSGDTLKLEYYRVLHFVGD
jgi:hypothetical protein